MKFRKLFFAIPILFIALVALGASIKEDTLKLGKPGSSADKTLDFDGSRLIRANQTSGKLEFSNDGGSNFADIGSGSGGAGGINLLTGDDNPGFESDDPPSSWTASGGSFTAETGSPGFGEQSGAFDANALSQTLDSNLKAVIPGLEGRNCDASIEYKYDTGSTGDYKLQIVDSGSSVIVEKDIDVTTGWFKDQLFFTCPTSESIRLRVISEVADPGLILLDEAAIGQGNFSFGIPQNTVREKILTSNVDINTTMGDLTFSDLEVGATYEVRLHAFSQSGSTDAGFNIQITNGVNTVGIFNVGGSTASVDQNIATTTVTFVAADASLTFVTAGIPAPGASTVFGNGTKTQTFVQLEKRNDLAGNVEESITLETVGSYVSAGFTGVGLTLPAGTSAFPVLSTSDGTIVNFGLIPAGAACLGVNGSGATTCNSEAVDEKPGITFVPNKSGLWQVCTKFIQTSDTVAVALNGIAADWYLSKMSLDGTSIIESSPQIHRHTNFTTTNATKTERQTGDICGLFNVQAGDEQRFELQLNQAQAGSGTVINSLEMSGGSQAGTYQQTWTARPWNEQFPTPVFTDLQNSLNGKLETNNGAIANKYVLGVVTCDGTPTIDSNFDASFISISNVGAALCQVNFANPFSATPLCQCTPSTASASQSCRTANNSASQATIQLLNSAGGANDGQATILCIGQP